MKPIPDPEGIGSRLHLPPSTGSNLVCLGGWKLKSATCSDSPTPPPPDKRDEWCSGSEVCCTRFAIIVKLVPPPQQCQKVRQLCYVDSGSIGSILSLWTPSCINTIQVSVPFKSMVTAAAIVNNLFAGKEPMKNFVKGRVRLVQSRFTASAACSNVPDDAVPVQRI